MHARAYTEDPPNTHNDTMHAGPSSSGSGSGADSVASAARRRVLLMLPTAAAAAAAALQLSPLAPGGSLLAPASALAASGGVVPSPEVKAAIDAALDKLIQKAKAPVALRLAYHDAGTFSKKAGDGGLNASIRFELDRPENFGLKRGWKLIEQVRGRDRVGLRSW